MKSKNQTGFTPVEWVLLLVIVGILAGTGLYVYRANSNTNDTLNLAAGTQVSTKGATAAPSAALKKNTSDAITSGNTAALEGYMAGSVNVVIAGSEKTGAETAAKAVSDLSYLNSGTAPWNFSLSTATLNSYAKGSYKQYFGANTIVGQSANGYTVSFGVNGNGKIDTVFMSASTDQLR